MSDLPVPILTDFPAGHEVPNLTLPLGTDVELIAEETSGTGWLAYREDALVAEGGLIETAIPATLASAT